MIVVPFSSGEANSNVEAMHGRMLTVRIKTKG